MSCCRRIKGLQTKQISPRMWWPSTEQWWPSEEQLVLRDSMETVSMGLGSLTRLWLGSVTFSSWGHWTGSMTWTPRLGSAAVSSVAVKISSGGGSLGSDGSLSSSFWKCYKSGVTKWTNWLSGKFSVFIWNNNKIGRSDETKSLQFQIEMNRDKIFTKNCRHKTKTNNIN